MVVIELEVTPLAFESFGVRSMATHVNVGDIGIVIDPAVALSPNRFGFAPHPVEKDMKAMLWKRVKETVTRADVIIVTHYHFDHMDPKEPEIYSGKTVLLKHPHKMINRSQRERAASFLPRIKKVTKEIDYADGRSFFFGDTEISFSKPLPHGSTDTRGFVIEASVRAEKTFVYTSDVQGPALRKHVDFILDENPDLVFVDGPSTYIDTPFMPSELREANKNLVRIVRESSINHLVVDHHLTRDLNYKRRIRPVYEAGEEHGVIVECASELLNMEPKLLEARRQELYEISGGG